MSAQHFTSYGGGVDQTAVIGHPPESRTWKPGDPMFQPAIHPTARIEAYVTIDAGERIPTAIAARVWLMKHVHVGHDAIIGKDCELAPGVVIGGWAVIGPRVKIGVNACVLPFVKIGAGVQIGAGAVVTKDYDEGILVGNPARPMERRTDRCETCRGGGKRPGPHGIVRCEDCEGTGRGSATPHDQSKEVAA
jgi:acyl-[acyl carrier protein]--UDP-N-acetylglucosamine O-acyltransferase